MAWLHNGRIIKAGKSWTDGETQHPSNWMLWSDSEKTDRGLVWQDDPDTSYDNRFYWARDVERSLEDINVVDEDDNPVIDPLTGVQQIQPGLKTNWIKTTKSTANSLLSKSDWYVTRKAENNTAIPSDINTYRNNVRTACNTIETAINDCTTLNEFKALFETPVDSDGTPTGNAPIYNFPEEV